MKEYYLDNFFVSYSNRFFPIKYISQNKDINMLRNSCFRRMLGFLDKSEFENQFDGIFFAVTNEIIVKRLKKSKRIRVISIRILGVKNNINHLKKYITGDNTACKECDEKKCSIKMLVNKESDNKKTYFILFWID